jgi:hypothetical protein
MKAYKDLVKYALKNNDTISVYDGEEWQVRRSASFQEIIDAIESVEMAEIRIRDKDGVSKAWAQIVHDTGEDEHVADHTDNAYMDEWSHQYFKQEASA